MTVKSLISFKQVTCAKTVPVVFSSKCKINKTNKSNTEAFMKIYFTSKLISLFIYPVIKLTSKLNNKSP